MTARDVIAEMRARANRAHPSGPDLCLLDWADRLESTLAQPSGEAVAWLAADGRVIDAKAKAAGLRSGGATGSATAIYDTPLYTTPPAPLGGLTEGEREAVDRIYAALASTGDVEYWNATGLVGADPDRDAEALQAALRRLTAPRAEGVDAPSDATLARVSQEVDQSQFTPLEQWDPTAIGMGERAPRPAALTAAAPKVAAPQAEAGEWPCNETDRGALRSAAQSVAQSQVKAVEDGLTSKQAWWAGARAGLGLAPDVPRAEVAKALEAARLAQPAAQGGDGWTDEQIARFLSVAFRHVRIVGEFTLTEIRQGITAALAPQRSDNGDTK